MNLLDKIKNSETVHLNSHPDENTSISWFIIPLPDAGDTLQLGLYVEEYSTSFVIKNVVTFPKQTPRESIYRYIEYDTSDSSVAEIVRSYSSIVENHFDKL